MGRIFNHLTQLLRSLEVKAKILMMNDSKSTICPPDVVRGMKDLDRTKFVKTVTVPSILVNRTDVPQVLPVVKKSLLKVPKIKGMIDSDDSSKKLILLNPEQVKTFSDLPEESRNVLGKLGYDIKFADVPLSYENFSADDVLKAVLPADKESCASYSVIGHIIQINLRDHLLGYEKLIGQVLLDKVPVAKTVVCKTDAIDNTFRTFAINIVCGEDNLETTVKEHGCTYELDFSKVYWNSRLSTEHMRIANRLKKGSILYDVFAGIGPFSIPAAKRGCTVLANDLNPHSFKYLERNIKLNKVTGRVTTFNKDGGDFLRTDVKEHLLEQWKKEGELDAHITMNLPALAVTFLKHLKGLLPEEVQGTKEPPTVHVYCFTKNAEDPAASAVAMVEENLGAELGTCLKKVHNVRTVSNMKEMMAVSFSVPPQILFAPEPEGPPAKKPCISVSDS